MPTTVNIISIDLHNYTLTYTYSLVCSPMSSFLEVDKG
jgi:hypothetical protein